MKIEITSIATVSNYESVSTLYDVIAWRHNVYKSVEWVIGITQSDRIIAVNVLAGVIGLGGTMLASQEFWGATLGKIGIEKGVFAKTTLTLQLGEENLLWYNGLDSGDAERCGGTTDIEAMTGVKPPVYKTTAEDIKRLFERAGVEFDGVVEHMAWDARHLDRSEAYATIIAQWRADKERELVWLTEDLKRAAERLTADPASATRTPRARECFPEATHKPRRKTRREPKVD